MVKSWALNDAKTGFSELIERAQLEPQIVTKHGRETAVVLSIEQYTRLLPTANAWLELRPSSALLTDSPDFERLETTEREISFE